MSKKTIIIIITSVFAGFLLRSCLSGTLININLGEIAKEAAGVETSKSVIAKGKPILKLEKVEIPKSVSLGSSFMMSVYFKPLRRIDGNYKMFVHLYKGNRDGWINADRRPIPASNEWQPNKITKIGPIQIFIPEDNPLGTYKIEAGLFRGEKTSQGSRFVRLPYTNQRGHIIGTIKVVKAKPVSEASILEGLRRRAAGLGYKDYFVGVESSLVKIPREITRFKSPLSDTVKISLAKNEFEAGQIIIIPYRKNLENVKVYMTELKDSKGNVIENKYVRFSLVGYVPTGEPDYPTPYVGFWPDPLKNMETFNVVTGEVQPLWIRVYAPQEVPQGTYYANIIIKPQNAKSKKVKLEVKVFDFTLPVRGHLKTAFDLYTIYIRRYYNARGEDYRLLLEKFWDAMLKHRISPIYAGELPRIRRSKQGVFMNLTRFGQDVENNLKKGLTAFGIGQFGGSFDNKWPSSGKIKEVFSYYLNYLRSTGLLDMAYIYAYDEPSLAKAGVVKRISQTLHSVSKDLRILVTAAPNERFGDDVDIWVPHIIYYRQKEAEREKAKGKEVWWYVSSQRPGIPGFNIDIPGIDNRIVFWMNWKYKVDGVLYWCVNRWGKRNPWETAEIYPHQNGNGYLFYPGDEGPIDSIRAELIRDGLEDYEYFYLLRTYLEKLKEQNRHSPEIAKAEKLLNIDGIVKTVNDYTHEPEKLLERRSEVAQEIERIKMQLQ